MTLSIFIRIWWDRTLPPLGDRLLQRRAVKIRAREAGTALHDFGGTRDRQHFQQ
jgi:hypothetical protein